MVYPVGMTENCEKIFILLQITLSNTYGLILSIFMEMKSSTNIIFVPNLKEIKTQDGFHEF